MANVHCPGAASGADSGTHVDLSRLLQEADSHIPKLSPSLHGFSCNRGELWLSEEEMTSLVAVLESAGYGFKRVEDESVPLPNKKRKTAASGPGSYVAQQLSSVLNRSSLSRPSMESSSQQRRAPPSSDGRARRRGDAKTTSAAAATDSTTRRSRPSGSSAPPSVLTASPKPGAASSIPVRVSRRRREVLTGDWADACMAVTELLEQEPAARWFVQPVDPIQVPDYLEKISCPMDLQTVRQKLSHRMYSHPFRWQEDIRTIFFNAFTYHMPGNLVWSDALYLASLFEQLCKDHVGVNPYAVYSTPAAKPPPSMAPTTRPKSDTAAAVMDRGKGTVSLTAAAAGSDQPADTIVLEASKLRELLARAATAAAAQHHEPLEKPWKPISSSVVGGGSRPPEPLIPPATLPTPTLPPPPPPPLGSLRPGEKGPNVMHRRLIAAQFRQLDVHLRHAIMELVKDELGVASVAGACDPNFVIDLELLPYLKQRQLMAYLRTLDAFQRKMVQEGYHPTLVSDLRAAAPPPPAAAPPSPHRVVEPEEPSSSSSSEQGDDTSSSNSIAEASVHPTSPTVASSGTTTSLGSHSPPPPLPADLSHPNVHLVPNGSEQQHAPPSSEAATGAADTSSSSALSPSTPSSSSSDVEDALEEGGASEQVDDLNPPPPKTDVTATVPYDSGGGHMYLPPAAPQQRPTGFGKAGGYRVARMRAPGSSDSPSDDDGSDNTDDEANSLLQGLNEAGTVTSAWGEWKAKVIQSKIQLKMGNEENRDLLSSIVGSSDRERDAELADAEI